MWVKYLHVIIGGSHSTLIDEDSSRKHEFLIAKLTHTHTYTHTHIYIYTYIQIHDEDQILGLKILSEFRIF